MMWNWLVSGLASGATLLLYDGSPFAADGDILFDYADAGKNDPLRHLGKIHRSPCQDRPSSTRHPFARHCPDVMSTGSPLVPEGFAYVYDAIKADVCLSSISGGTDILSCFVLGGPYSPYGVARSSVGAWAWRLTCSTRTAGRCVKKGRVGGTRHFLLCRLASGAMSTGRRYHAAYFERFENIWCHGDFCEIPRMEADHSRPFGCHAESGGVRIGTAEIYRQVEKLTKWVESLVIGQDWDRDVRVVLFVRLREGLTLDDELIARIGKTIRDNTTPRHVPARILQVGDIPRVEERQDRGTGGPQYQARGRAVKNVEAPQPEGQPRSR